jgi:D-alanyl-lipoteichoic acid acyltransferase DltB (MBOAT superfamily)
MSSYSGLCKKMLLENNLVLLINNALAKPYPSFSVLHTGSYIAIGSALQIYGDFSGYSDIACGLSR